MKLSSLVQGRALAVRIPRHVKAALSNDLANLLPTGDRKADYRIEKALASITTSLDKLTSVSRATMLPRELA